MIRKGGWGWKKEISREDAQPETLREIPTPYPPVSMTTR